MSDSQIPFSQTTRISPTFPVTCIPELAPSIFKESQLETVENSAVMISSAEKIRSTIVYAFAISYQKPRKKLFNADSLTNTEPVNVNSRVQSTQLRNGHSVSLCNLSKCVS